MNDCLRYIHKNQSEIKVYGGMKNVLFELSKEFEICILTSNLKDTVKNVFDRNKIKVNFIHQKSPLFSKD